MNHREKLEMAAKAAGYEVKFLHPTSESSIVQINNLSQSGWVEWWPDDAPSDSLRLALDLNISIKIDKDYVMALNEDGSIRAKYDRESTPFVNIFFAVLDVAAEMGARL